MNKNERKFKYKYLHKMKPRNPRQSWRSEREKVIEFKCFSRSCRHNRRSSAFFKSHGIVGSLEAKKLFFPKTRGCHPSRRWKMRIKVFHGKNFISFIEALLKPSHIHSPPTECNQRYLVSDRLISHLLLLNEDNFDMFNLYFLSSLSSKFISQSHRPFTIFSSLAYTIVWCGFFCN